MERRKLGVTLRLVGPLIQVISLVLMFKLSDKGYGVLGMPLGNLLAVTFGFGFLLVLAGIYLSPPRRTRP